MCVIPTGLCYRERLNTDVSKLILGKQRFGTANICPYSHQLDTERLTYSIRFFINDGRISSYSGNWSVEYPRKIPTNPPTPDTKLSRSNPFVFFIS